MEQKYAYLSCTGRALYDDVLTDALDALKHDIGGEADEDFDEKETCLEMLKKFLEDKILTIEDYEYLYMRVRDFYHISLPYPYAETEMEIIHKLWGN